jgi:tetratricopeptide (TPR) repeat protein
MGRLTASLVERFLKWESSAQRGFLLAVGLAIVMFLIATLAPSADVRLPAAISFIALLVVMQGIFLWANRNMVTPYTQAQRAYMAGNFAQAKQILEEIRVTGKQDMNVLTLLGNTYRQLGELDSSERVLSECLNIYPKHYFPLYGFGRTLLAQGRYDEAREYFTQALEQGAPSVTQFDLAEAYYRQADTQTAKALLLQVRDGQSADQLSAEPHRLLMANYFLYRIDGGNAPDNAQIHDGILFWQTQATLFQHTPYGESVASDVQFLEDLLK